MGKKNIFLDITNETLKENVKKDFGISVSKIQKINTGYGNQVYTGLYKNKKIFIRINKNKNIYPIEIACIELLRKNGIPTPKVLFYQKSPKHIKLSTMILEKARGKNISLVYSNKKTRDELYEDAGKVLKRINQIDIKGFGPLTINIKNKELKGAYKTWKEYWNSKSIHLIENSLFLKSKKILTQQEYQKLKKIHRYLGNQKIVSGKLLDRDFHQVHLFVSQKKISGVIDFSLISSGDPLYDVARTIFFQNNEQQKYFKKGYGVLKKEKTILEMYLVMIALEKVYWRLQNNLPENGRETIGFLKKAIDEIDL